MESTLSPIEKPDGCTGTCCNDFYRIESLQHVPEPTLSGRIHPLFAKAKLHCLNSQLDEEAAFGILGHASLLATKFLKASLPFWHSLLLGNIRDQGELAEWKNAKGETGRKKQWEIYNERRILTSTQERDTESRLRELAEYVHYQVSSNDLTPGVEGEAFTSSEGWISTPRDPRAFWSGRHSKVQLTDHFVTTLRRGHSGDAVNYHWHAFQFAKTLVHELAHAAVNARRPEVEGFDPNDASESPGNLFFENSALAEPGFEWEARTFGGIIQRIGKHHTHHADSVTPLPASFYNVEGQSISFEGMICRRQWPCNQIYESYTNNDGQIGKRGGAAGILLTRATYWNVKFKEIHQLFQKEFWEETDLKDSLGPLWPVQETGMMVPRATANVLPDGFRLWNEKGLMIHESLVPDPEDEEDKDEDMEGSPDDGSDNAEDIDMD